MSRALRIWAALAVLASAALALALASGSHAIAPLQAWTLLFAPDGSTAAEVVHRLRLPRALAAFGTGALLGLAGAWMQVLLRNPLADPYVLGVSGGAAFGALGALALGLGAASMHAGAFAGALFTVVVVFALAHRDLSHRASADTDGAARLLLTGVMLAAGWAALVMLLLALAVPQSRQLNALLRGPLVARTLGVNVVRQRRALYLQASLAAAVAVTTAGSIGFVGLVVPHALRLAFGNDQRVLVPASALAGGALLLLADTAARTVLAPTQLPVGVVTALLGVPTFLWLLLRTGRAT